MSDRVQTINFRTRRQKNDERRARREAGLGQPIRPGSRACWPRPTTSRPASRQASSATTPTSPASTASPAPA